MKTQKHVGQKWVLVSESGEFPDSRSLLAKLTPEMKHTYVYDERDNRRAKISFFSAVLKTQFAALEIP